MAAAIKPGYTWAEVFAEARAAAPETFTATGIRNLALGEWQDWGEPSDHHTPVDGSVIPGPPVVSREQGERAMAFAVRRHEEWTQTSLAERIKRTTTALDLLEEHRDLLSKLLVWEIGKPWRLATTDVDRAISGVRWYIEEIERQIGTRIPLDGPVSNIASWNYPMSVQVHAELVQALAGNAVIAKTPTQGGFHTLTLAHAMMHRAGLPVTLLSGHGAQVGNVLVRGDGIGAVAFVGGRANGRKVANDLTDTGRRHMLEEEGLNTWGIWDFTGWDALAAHLKKGFEYGKQRCTAYPRYVVQRELFDQFLEMYLPVVNSLQWGHPLLVENPADELPELDFGPLIHARKVTELQEQYAEGVQSGGIPLVRRDVSEGRFLEGQDTSAYIAPATLLKPPSSWSLRHSEPFGPIDSIVLVDTEAELLAAMNASNGALVASVATDDPDFAARVGEQLQSFKVGVNQPRSRGDRDETFGGRGASWRGAFVGGDLLVQAVTRPADGSDEQLYGNFPSYSLYPERV